MKLRFYTVFILVVLVLINACTGNNKDEFVPDTILNEEKFTKLIVDFALAESTSNMNVKNVPAQKMDSAYAFDPLKENNISKTAYDSAISFYSNHPLLYKKIYENVLTILSKMQVKTDSLKAVPVLK